MNRDSVTLRENPCSSKTIRQIRKIRTELNEHGNTRMQMNKNIRKIREIRTELNEHGDTRKHTEADEQKYP